jgi:hypothetical protein
MVALNEDRICARAMARAAVAMMAEKKAADAGPKLKNRFVRVESDAAAAPSHLNEPWRRVTGITVELEPHMDRRERRAGIGALFDKIKLEYLDAGISAVMEAAAGNSGWVHPSSASANGCARRLLPQGEEEKLGASLSAGGGPLTPRTNGCASALSPGGEGFGVWASEGSTRQVLGLVCQDYNISAYQLNLLAREYRGVTATELIDGLRVKPVMGALADLLKGYAYELWLTPGNYVNCLITDKKLRVYSCDSKFFVDPAEDWRKAEIYETRAERLEALTAEFDKGWNRGMNSRDGFAVKLGFRSFSELNRACLNVYGKTVRQLAYDIMKDIVEFYLAAEIRELRQLACVDSQSHGVMRARYIYGGDCEKPVGPFFDLWETSDAGWLSKMEGWLKGWD